MLESLASVGKLEEETDAEEEDEEDETDEAVSAAALQPSSAVAPWSWALQGPSLPPPGSCVLRPAPRFAAVPAFLPSASPWAQHPHQPGTLAAS